MTRMIRSIRAASVGVALAAGLAASALASGGGGTEIVQFLANTGVDADATFRARWRQDDDSTRFDVELEHLPAGEYELWVASAQHESISVDGLGHGEIEFVTPQDGGKPLFDFEVLDQILELRQGLTVFFSDTFNGTGSGGGGGGGGDKTKTEVFLVNVGPDFDAHGSLRYESKPGKVKFGVRVEDLAPGTWQIRVAGTPVGEIVATGPAEAEVEFQDPVEPGKVLLNFDPLGAQVDIADGDTIYLSAILPASDTATGGKAPGSGKKSGKDMGKGKGDSLLMLLQNSGIIPEAIGTAKLSKTGEIEFEVEIEHLPTGDYGLFVGGVEVATISVAAAHGHADFSTSPGAGQALLDFEVQGQLVAVTSGVDTILSVVFPLSVQSALGGFKKELHFEDHVRINLASTGADLDARGTADFRDRTSHDTLTVSVVDLAVGTYDVVIGGEVKAGVLVVTKADGKARVVFDTLPKGQKLLLDVPVAGMLIQVTPEGDGATVLLAGTIE